MSGKAIIVGRAFEVDDLKKDTSTDWRKYIEKINENHGPVLALDYSYLSLLADKDAPVGGVLYLHGKNDIEFYAPLIQWSAKIAELLEKD